MTVATNGSGITFMIGAVTRRFPELQLVNEQPDWGPNFAFRGLSTLLVRV